jgi:hypothetical protein
MHWTRRPFLLKEGTCFVQKLILARRSRMNYNMHFSGIEVTRVGVCHVAYGVP